MKKLLKSAILKIYQITINFSREGGNQTEFLIFEIFSTLSNLLDITYQGSPFSNFIRFIESFLKLCHKITMNFHL